MAPRPKGFDIGEKLRTATSIFWRFGFSGISHAKVLGAMGIGRQSSYDTFGNRRELFERAFGEYADQRARVLRALRAEDASLDTLWHHFSSSIRYFVGHPNTPACLATRTQLDPDADIRPLGDALMREMEAGFAHCLRGAVAAGEVRDDLPVEDAAYAARLLWHGIGAEASAGTRVETLEAAVRVVFDGWKKGSD